MIMPLSGSKIQLYHKERQDLRWRHSRFHHLEDGFVSAFFTLIERIDKCTINYKCVLSVTLAQMINFV